MMAARSTDPAVGAFLWASGNQVWSGKSGAFTAKAMAKPANSHRPVLWAKSDSVAIVTRSNVSGPPVCCWNSTAVATIDTSMKMEPMLV